MSGMSEVTLVSRRDAHTWMNHRSRMRMVRRVDHLLGMQLVNCVCLR